MVTLRSRLRAIILGFALSLALSGCSAVKLGYGALPELTYWWLDGHFDFDETQAAQARRELARIHAWHREQELPGFAALLEQLEELAPGAIAPEQACAVVDTVRGRLRHLADMAAPSLAEVAVTLQPRQLQHLESELRKRNGKWRRDWVDPPAPRRLEQRLRRTVDRVEDVYGRLDDAQRTLLRQALARSGFDAQRAYAERERRQHDLLATLRQVQAQPQQATALLRGWLERMQQPPDAAARTHQEAWIEDGCHMFAALHETTSAAQRERALKRLQGWRRDLRELSAQP